MPPPSYHVGQVVQVRHGRAWYMATIVNIDYAWAFPPEVYVYTICWEWGGWPNQDVYEEDILPPNGKRQRKQTRRYTPNVTGN